MEGFGAQFNTNLFTRAGQPQDVTPDRLDRLRATIENLRPGHSRIFIRRGLRPETPAGREAPEFVALMNTIALAQHGRANVNLTWWGQGPYGSKEKLAQLDWPHRDIHTWPQPNRRKWPEELTNPAHPRALTAPRTMMKRFALIIEEARRRGFTCVTHATIQNEVNGAACDLAKQRSDGLSMRFYELLYRFFDEELRARRDPLDPSRTLRDVIRIVGGDLVSDNQKAWLEYMHANMEVPRPGFERVLDGYSIHVYWKPSDEFPAKPETRLVNLEQTMRSLGGKLPVYVTEYGVRNLGPRPRPGRLAGVPMEQTPESAFQHAWFNAVAPQYGCAGLAKWVLYRTDKTTDWGEWGMVGSASTDFERYPVYRVTRLFNHVVGPGWMPAGLGGETGAAVRVARFAPPGGSDESLVVLNHGPRQDVRIQGLQPQRRYSGADWNRDGDGTLHPLSPVTADAGGAAKVTVPRCGVVALSTRQLGL